MKNNRLIVAGIVSFLLGGVAVSAVTKYLNTSATTVSAGKPANLVAPGKSDIAVVKFAEAAPQLAQIRTTVAAVSAIPLVEPLAARIGFDESVTVRINSPATGRLVEMLVKPGDSVKVGQSLARIDSPDLGSAAADVEKAHADQDRKLAAFNRAKTLFDAEVLAKRDLEAAKADLHQADAELNRATLRLANLNATRGRINGQRFELASPIAGTVVDRQANTGMEVRPDLPNPLFVVSDLKKLWALIDVPEQALNAVSVGSAVTLEVSAYPKQLFEAHIDYVSPVLDPTTRRIQARAALRNSDGLLHPEMYAKALVSGKDGRKALRVAISSLVSDGAKSFVFVESEPGKFEKRLIVLAAQNREFAYATRGIEVGDRVVSTGALLLNSELAASAQ